MNLTKRLVKLEQAEIFASSLPPLTRLKVALNDAAMRIAGKQFDAVSADEATEKQIWKDLQEGFIRKLSDVDLETLIAECERTDITSGTRSRDAVLTLSIPEGIGSPWTT